MDERVLRRKKGERERGRGKGRGRIGATPQKRGNPKKKHGEKNSNDTYGR
jgi:hypothetical protein